MKKTALLLLVYFVVMLTKAYLYFFGNVQNQFELLLTVSLIELVVTSCIFWKIYIKCALRSALLIFLLAQYAYATVPLAVLAVGLNPFPFSLTAVWYAMWLQSTAFSSMWLAVLLLIRPSILLQYEFNLLRWFDELKITKAGLLLLAIIGLAMASWYFYNFYSSGAAKLVGNGSRVELANAVETGKAWLVQYAFTSWAVVIAIVLFSKCGYRRLISSAGFYSAVAIVVFYYAYLSVGNRREIVILILFVASFACIMGKTKVAITPILLVTPLLIYRGMTRSLGSRELSDGNQLGNLINAIGEFIFPNFPLIHSIQTHVDYLLGLSYLRLPGSVLPSFGLWEKPTSLAQEFALSYGNGLMGYAYTPIAEGFVNFGVAGCLFVPFLIIFCIRLLLILKRKGLVFAGIIPFAFSMDIGRGEFSTIVLEGLIFLFFILIFTKVAGMRSKNKSFNRKSGHA